MFLKQHFSNVYLGNQGRRSQWYNNNYRNQKPVNFEAIRILLLNSEQVTWEYRVLKNKITQNQPTEKYRNYLQTTGQRYIHTSDPFILHNLRKVIIRCLRPKDLSSMDYDRKCIRIRRQTLQNTPTFTICINMQMTTNFKLQKVSQSKISLISNCRNR